MNIYIYTLKNLHLQVIAKTIIEADSIINKNYKNLMSFTVNINPKKYLIFIKITDESYTKKNGEKVVDIKENICFKEDKIGDYYYLNGEYVLIKDILIN